MKRFLALVLTLSLALTLAACGGTASSTSTTSPSSETPSTEAPSTEAPASDAPAPAAGENLVIGFAQVGHESDWRNANTQSMQNTFSEANGYTLIFDDADNDQARQITAIRNFIQQQVDYIVLAPGVETGWDVVLGEAKEADIPVIIVDRMIDVEDESLYTAWVGSNFLQEGIDSANWLDNAVGDKAINIVTLQGTIGSSAQIGRTKGFGDIAATKDNWTILEQQTGNFEQIKGQEVMESFLKKYNNIDVVVCENDNMAFGAIDAIEAAGKTCGPDGDITIISFDAVAAAFDMMIDGKINVCVECNPLHGPRVAEIISKLQAGETVEKIQYVEEGIFEAKDAAAIKPSRAY